MAKLLALALVAACGSSHHPRAVDRDREPPPVEEPLAPPVTFGPLDDEATTWNQPLAGAPAPPVADNVYVEPSPKTLADEIFLDLQVSTRGRGVLVRDARLDRAASELATVVPQGVALSQGLVEFALHAHGIVEPAARTAVTRATTASAALAELAPQLGEALDFGNVQLGIGGDPTVVLVTYRAFATIVSAPRFVPPRGSFELVARLDAKHRDPRVTVTHDDGSIEHPRVTIAGDGSFHAPIACGEATHGAWLDIEAGDAPEPLALVPVACGTTPVTTFQIEPSANLQATAEETRLTSIINRERLAAHLAPLVTDPRATLTARQYAELMRGAHSVHHDLGGKLPADRLRAAGLVPPLLLETTLEADGLGRASELLVNDPAYHKDLLSPSVTHVGIGIAETADHEQFVNILYLKLPRPIDPAAATQRITDQIRGTDFRTRKIQLDFHLGVAARQFATRLAAGWPPNEIWADLHDRIAATASHYDIIDRTITQLDDLDHLADKQFVDNHAIKGMGIGVAQSVRSGPLGGRIWVIVIFGM